MFSEEDFGITIMWIILAQLGVRIDAIQDDHTVNFSVPSMSDYTAESRDKNIPLVDNAPRGQPIAGDLLLTMANNFFSENGLKPNGRIRSEYWTSLMGEVASFQMQQEMQK